MYISKIYIKNYRWIKEETLKFNSYNTLVGKNDCWKSTIINAIKLFFIDDKVTNKDYNYYLDPPENIFIEVTLSNVIKEDLKSFLVTWSKVDWLENIFNDYVTDWDITIKKEWIFNIDKEVSSKVYMNVNSFVDNPIHSLTTAKLKTLWTRIWATPPVGWTWDNSDLERRSCIKDKLLADWVAREYETLVKKHADLKELFPTVELLKADQSIDTTTTDFKWTFTTEVKAIIKAEKESWASSTLNDIEEKISTKIKEESDVIKSCMSEHISDLDELIITPSFTWEKWIETTDVKVKLTWDQQPIPLENKWSWYRRLFMVWRLRYLADKKISDNTIYLIEEPETFLHPSAQEEMLDSLIELSTTNQIFTTTHSPIFTWATKLDSITLCKKESTELKYEQRDDETFLIDIAEQLWVKPSHNISDTYKTIVFVEWSNDRSFFNIASEKLWKTFHTLEAAKKIAIIDWWGWSLNNFIDINFFESQWKNMFLVIDSDEYDSSQIIDPNVQKWLNNQIVKNWILKTKFETKAKSIGYILKKKNIDTYYHPKAIERITGITMQATPFADNFCTAFYFKELRATNPGIDIHKKNWIAVFNEMTPTEWEAVSNWELESIFDKIVTTTNT